MTAGRSPPKPAGGQGAAPIPLRPRRPCPICGRPSARETHPFCSRRCADVDLGRWLSGSYVVPGRSVTEDSDENPAD